MNGRFCGRLWHALRRYLGRELVSLVAQFLDGWGIQLHWDFLTDTPLRALLPELHARGVPEDEWPTDHGYHAVYFGDGYGHVRDGCDSSSESDSSSEWFGMPRPRNRRRLRQRQRLHGGWRLGIEPPDPRPLPLLW